MPKFFLPRHVKVFVLNKLIVQELVWFGVPPLHSFLELKYARQAYTKCD